MTSHIGSDFDAWLDEEGIRSDVDAVAASRLLGHTVYTKPILRAVSVHHDSAARIAVVCLENGLEAVLSDDSPLLNMATPDDICILNEEGQ